MANVPFSALHELVLPYLPGADTPIIDSTIRKVVREWMKRTTCVRQTFQFNTANGLSDYQLLPGSGQVASIMAVWQDPAADPLRVATEDLRRTSSPARPTHWWEMIPGVVKFYPTPNGIYPITVNAVLTLTQTDTTLPEELVANYGEQLTSGVLSMMMSMPGKPWTQSKAAIDMGRVFNGAIKTERAKIRDGGQPNQSTFTAARKFGC